MAVVVLTHETQPSANAIASELAATFWERRLEFVDDLVSIDDALNKISTERSDDALPFVIGDMGDRVLAGAPGDSTSILAATLDHPYPFKAAFPVTDAAAVQAAQAAGLESTVSLSLGGAMTPGFEPLAITGTVANLTDGRFQMRGPYQEGEPTSMGPSAVVTIDDRLSIVISSNPAFSHDPNAFESQGVAIEGLDFIVVKSGYHFELNFESIAVPLLIASPGLSFYTPGGMPRHLSRIWPDHDVDGTWSIPPRVFDRRAQS